ncbi:MAG: nuclease [Candidatus Pelagibacter sp.]|nr:nuclease [Candidatus Pelagibacter sp.]|tara:strand:+ start:114 stop:575 length:462 start_codon:yes stop_codon:yes gene_type:complete
MKQIILIIILIIFSLNTKVQADNIKIIDGDTIIINKEKIRFSGIDTPELKQTCQKNNKIYYCGIKAKRILIRKIGKNIPKCIKEGKDIYKRTLAECFINGESLSAFLVRSGYAFAYRKYSKKFISDEEFAKANNLGMWSMKFQYPWEYRKSTN